MLILTFDGPARLSPSAACSVSTRTHPPRDRTPASRRCFGSNRSGTCPLPRRLGNDRIRRTSAGNGRRRRTSPTELAAMTASAKRTLGRIGCARSRAADEHSADANLLHRLRDRLEIGTDMHRAIQRQDGLRRRLDPDMAEHRLVRRLLLPTAHRDADATGPASCPAAAARRIAACRVITRPLMSGKTSLANSVVKAVSPQDR